MILPDEARIAISNIKLETDAVTRQTCINIEYRINTPRNTLDNKKKEYPAFWGTLVFPLNLAFLDECNIKLTTNEFNMIDTSLDNLYELKKIAENVIKIVLKYDASIVDFQIKKYD